MELLNEALETRAVADVANSLGVCKGTINRWQLLQNVPPQYTFDLLRLTGKEIDYEQYSSKEKDQFFTPHDLAEDCWNIFNQKTNIDVSQYTFIEPSAGDGTFLEFLPKDTIALDIEPRHSSVKKANYLEWIPEDTTKRYIVFGNPPFGLRGHVALQFINHSSGFADYVCFILPQLFESDGKGSPRKRVTGYRLLHSEKLSGMFRTPEQTEVEVNGVFQIWSKHESNPDYELTTVPTDTLQIYSLSDGGTASSTRNKDKIGHCDLYLPSTCFGRDVMKAYTSFEDLPGRRGYGIVFLQDREALIQRGKMVNWADVSFLSTNSALNLRTSIIYRQFL